MGGSPRHPTEGPPGPARWGRARAAALCEGSPQREPAGTPAAGNPRGRVPRPLRQVRPSPPGDPALPWSRLGAPHTRACRLLRRSSRRVARRGRRAPGLPAPGGFIPTRLNQARAGLSAREGERDSQPAGTRDLQRERERGGGRGHAGRPALRRHPGRGGGEAAPRGRTRADTPRPPPGKCRLPAPRRRGSGAKCFRQEFGWCS